MVTRQARGAPGREGHTVWSLERSELELPPEDGWRVFAAGPDGTFTCQCGVKVTGPWSEVANLAEFHIGRLVSMITTLGPWAMATKGRNGKP